MPRTPETAHATGTPLTPLILDGLVYSADLCRWLRVTEQTIRRWITGKGVTPPLPKPKPLGTRHVWLVKDLLPWLEETGVLDLRPRPNQVEALTALAQGLGYTLTPASKGDVA